MIQRKRSFFCVCGPVTNRVCEPCRDMHRVRALRAGLDPPMSGQGYADAVLRDGLEKTEPPRSPRLVSGYITDIRCGIG